MIPLDCSPRSNCNVIWSSKSSFLDLLYLVITIRILTINKRPIYWRRWVVVIVLWQFYKHDFFNHFPRKRFITPNKFLVENSKAPNYSAEKIGKHDKKLANTNLEMASPSIYASFKATTPFVWFCMAPYYVKEPAFFGGTIVRSNVCHSQVWNY